jgi:hypothetical protein
VQRVSRNANQIACLHLDRDNRALSGVDVEQPSAGNNVPDFVLVMAMLNVELRQHCV